MRNILFILAALFGIGAFGQTNVPTRQMLADTNGVVKWPTNITRIRIGGTEYTNLLGFGLSVTNGQLSVDTTQLPSGGGSGVVTSVTDDFEIDGGELALTNALGTGPLVRQSAASGFGTVTSVGASTTVSGLGFSGSPVTGSGTLSLTGTVAVASGGTGATDASGARTALSLVPGADVQAYDVDLAAIAALANSGIIVRTGSGTVAARTITGDTEAVVNNGDGVSGNPTLSIGAAIARDAEVAAAYQPLDPDLTQLATLNGGSLTNLNGTEIRSGTVAAARIDAAIARLDSPALDGTPTAPTASLGTSNSVLATTAYVQQLADLRQLTSTILTQLAALTNGSAGQVPTWTGANTLALSNIVSGGSEADVQVFAPGTNTWTKPSGKTAVYVLAIGGGGGGGSGRREAAGTVRGGGGGGGAGSLSEIVMPISLAGSTETVIVGSGGGGGAGRVSDFASGNGGTNGGSSTFGTKLFAGGGGGGGGGAAAGAVGGTASSGLWAGPNGAAASASGAAGSAGNSTTASRAAASGGSGGGVTSGDAVSGGGAGGQGPTMWRGSLGIAGGAAGSAGGNGGNGTSASADIYTGGAGGGGGGSSVSANAGNGGNGGLYGGGGGGGGASLNGFTSGTGGAGANGIVVVISY